MRRPSDRAQLWARWRERLDQRRAGDMRARDWPFDEPQCGRYQSKRHGQHVAVQIDIEQEIDPETGELLEPERLVAFVQGERFDDFECVVSIWQRCGAKPITDEEFRRLLNLPRIESLGRTVIT